MYDYSKIENFKIEDVDHEIHILGVKAPAMPWCVYIFLGFLIINPFLAFIAELMFISLVRKFYFSERSGFPLEYSKNFIKIITNVPLIKDLYADLRVIKQPKEAYRD